ncbi:hypothetical protein IQ247_06670 [Plectonema cf. radiosum LEGE 06105]|uniref:Uncharacterized protein n=1 Tax=Plectonema cf. radiosum LEGE 06105 TaxID=945769 RepID=A0A8J7JTN3_9CYAN|nr:hypothetical protein [Plectonema radiosum]MBE9212395.1 hypothetical protein [Plectonema cf. radiosum LEGE 06105]
MLNKFRSKALALALAAVILPACAETADNVTQQERENVTAEEVADNTNKYIGQTVTIRSNAINKISPATFAVTDDDFFGGDTILVVNATGETQPLPEGTELQITGEVQNFATADINQKYKLELDSKDYQTFEGKPAMIAQSIAPAPKPGQITTNPDQYYNQVIAVPGEIKDVTGNNVFVLEDQALIGANDLLVLVPNDPDVVPYQQNVKLGETVVATGTLEQFVIVDLEREYNFAWDNNVRTQLEADYKEKPVLIVKTIYPSALPNSLEK